MFSDRLLIAAASHLAESLLNSATCCCKTVSLSHCASVGVGVLTAPVARSSARITARMRMVIARPATLQHTAGPVVSWRAVWTPAFAPALANAGDRPVAPMRAAALIFAHRNEVSIGWPQGHEHPKDDDADCCR